MPAIAPRIRPSLAVSAALLVLGLALPAAAQYDFPRVGLSASADSWVDTLTVALEDEFTLYACVFGHDPGQPLGQSLRDVTWVVHQACCGASLDVLAVDLNPALDHVGQGPLAGVVSSAPDCLDVDGIVLATLTVRLIAPGAGQYLVAAGPFDFAHDCDGGTPLFMDMPVNVTVTSTSTPAQGEGWGALKASYR